MGIPNAVLPQRAAASVGGGRRELAGSESRFRERGEDCVHAAEAGGLAGRSVSLARFRVRAQSWFRAQGLERCDDMEYLTGAGKHYCCRNDPQHEDIAYVCG